MRGTISLMIIQRSRALASEKTESQAFPMIIRIFVLLLHFGAGKDPILKERLFKLANDEGNHGEDVKEYYFLSGQHADAFLYEIPLQVPTGHIPMTIW